jgi:TolB protein
MVQSVDGKDWYRLTSNGQDNAPVWSPAEGGQIAFSHYQHDHWEIYGVDPDGRNLRRLTDTPLKPSGERAHSVSPAWSPDGGYIAFLTDRTGKWEIWVMRANGTGSEPLFDGALDGLRLDYGHVAERALSWSK